ncbi:universal stress protein [Nocardioidaceae bacterium]|nr:universal stress protein [Nocardioidaceae bacterium]
MDFDSAPGHVTFADNDDLRDIMTGAVVVGVDGSSDSENALVWAAGRAAKERRVLVVLHAVNLAAAYSQALVYADGIDRDTLVRRFESNAQRVADEAAERAAALQPDLDVRALISRDDARNALLRAAHDAWMVVLGSRGRGPVRSMLLGSVGATVSRRAECPVVVVRPGGAGHRGGIVAGVDAGSSASSVLDFAFSEASVQRLPLTVLHTHVDKVALAVGLHTLGDARDTEDATRLLAEVVAGYQEKFPDVQVTRTVRGEEAASALLSTDPEASLVVVGRSRHSGPLAALRVGLATTVLEHANTTVAIVPTP